MSWVAVAIGVGTAVSGAAEANANRQRQKGLIGSAYTIAQQRMNLSQLDTRQALAERSGERGLDNGGGVTTGAPAAPGAVPSVGGAHTLGAQQTADEAREQVIEQNSLKNQTTADLSTVNANADQGIIGAAAAGISTAFGAKASLNERNNTTTGLPSGGAPGGTNTPNQDLASAPFGGIDVNDPVGKGWGSPAVGTSGAAGAATGNFNVNG